MADNVDVGQIGLGSIGRHFARHLLKAYGRLTVHDIAAQAVDDMVEAGAFAAASPGRLAASSEVIVLSLPTPEAVETVMLARNGVLAGARRDVLVIDTSTVGPETSRTIHLKARQRDIHYLDAPITIAAPDAAGTRPGLAGSVTFLCGGTERAFRRARPILDLLGRRAHFLGPSGSGSVFKLICNHMSSIQNLVVAEALALAASAGISAEVLLEVSRDTIAKSHMVHEHMAPRILARDFDSGFTVDLMLKDHRLMAELAHANGVPFLFNGLALEVYQMMRSAGRGGKNPVDAVNFYADLAGVDIYDPPPASRGDDD